MTDDERELLMAMAQTIIMLIPTTLPGQRNQARKIAELADRILHAQSGGRSVDG